MKGRWLRRSLLAGSLVVPLASALYLGSFFLIRHRAALDDQLMQSGARPRYVANKPLYFADGGSVGYVGWGYIVYRLNRTTLNGDEPDDFKLVGTELQFTCRAYFPILQRWLEDRQDAEVRDMRTKGAGSR